MAVSQIIKSKRKRSCLINVQIAPSNSNEGGDSFNPLGGTMMILNSRVTGGCLLSMMLEKIARTSSSERRRVVDIFNFRFSNHANCELNEIFDVMIICDSSKIVFLHLLLPR